MQGLSLLKYSGRMIMFISIAHNFPIVWYVNFYMLYHYEVQITSTGVDVPVGGFGLLRVFLK
jgi:hypothetical protein